MKSKIQKTTTNTVGIFIDVQIVLEIQSFELNFDKARTCFVRINLELKKITTYTI